MTYLHPFGQELEDHKPNFQGQTYEIDKEEDRYQVSKKGEEDALFTVDDKETATARAQALANGRSDTKNVAIIRDRPHKRTIGFGGKYLEDEQTTFGPEDEEEELVDDRRDKTSKKEKEDDEKAEFTKKAETLEPYADDQDDLEKFEDSGREDLEKLMDELNASEVLEEFQDKTELDADQMRDWLNDPCHRKASGGDADFHIKRNEWLILNATDEIAMVTKEVPADLALQSARDHVPEDSDLSYKTAIFQMMRTNSFLGRMYGVAEEHDVEAIPEDSDCPTDLEISLRNWGGSLINNPKF